LKKVREPFIFKTPLSLKDIIDEKWEFAQAEQKFGNVDPIVKCYTFIGLVASGRFSL